MCEPQGHMIQRNYVSFLVTALVLVMECTGHNHTQGSQKLFTQTKPDFPPGPDAPGGAGMVSGRVT